MTTNTQYPQYGIFQVGDYIPTDWLIKRRITEDDMAMFGYNREETIGYRFTKPDGLKVYGCGGLSWPRDSKVTILRKYSSL